MTVIEKKEALHRAIDGMEDEEGLDRMLNVLSEREAEMASPELIAILQERERQLATGEAKLIPIEEVNATIRAKYGFPR